jgi:hypothetical protein
MKQCALVEASHGYIQKAHMNERTLRNNVPCEARAKNVLLRVSFRVDRLPTKF